MTYLELQNKIFYMLRDENKERYDIEQVKSFINDGEKLYCQLTNYNVKKDTSILSVISQQEYDLPDDTNIVVAVSFNNNILEKINMTDILEDSDDIGEPAYYYITNNKIGLYPIPTEDNKEITIVYYANAGELSDDDESVIPKENQMFLVYYVAYNLALQGDDNRYTEFKRLANEIIQLAIRNDTYKEIQDKTLQVGENNNQSGLNWFLYHDYDYYNGV